MVCRLSSKKNQIQKYLNDLSLKSIYFVLIILNFKVNLNELLMNKLADLILKSVEQGIKHIQSYRLVFLKTNKCLFLDFKVRLSTLELTIRLIKNLTVSNKKSIINEYQVKCIEQAKEQSSFVLRKHFKVFLVI